MSAVTIKVAALMVTVSLFVIPLQLTYAQTFTISFSQPQCLPDGSALVTVTASGLEGSAFGFVVDNVQTFWGSSEAVPIDTMTFGPGQFEFGTHSFLAYQDLNVNSIHDLGEPSASTTFTVTSCQSPASIETLIGLAQSLGVNAGPLSQAVSLLTDANPNNDRAVCNQLDAFINQVTAKMRTGQLEQADQLLQAALSIKGTLNCS